jgi:EmrB/QacA subfamily drug resistance transporter
VLLTAIFMFTAASALCGVATSLSELTAFRVLQGVGGGLMTPVGMTMLWRAFPPAERIKASALLVVPTGLAPALGPVLGGLFVTDLSWRWVFFINVPIGLFAIAFGTVFLREQPRHRTGRFDLPGFAMAGVGLALLMYGLSEGPVKGWASPDVTITCILGAMLLAGLVAVELSRSDPLIALRLLGNRLFRSANIVMFCSTAAFLGMLYLAAIFFQNGLGLSALGAGLITFPEAIGVMAGAQMVTRLLYPRLGPRRIMMGGLAGVAVGMVAMSFVGDQTNLWLVRLAMLGMGVAMSGVFVPTQAAAFATISPADTGHASTFFNAERQLGGALGVAILTTVLSAVGVTSSVAGQASAHLAAYHAAFLTAAVLALIGVAAAATIRDSDAANTITRRRTVVVPARQTGDELAARARV